MGRDSKRWRTTIDVVTTFARTPCIFVISTGFVVRKTRNARSPTPEMMIVPASNCWTDIIMFWPLSWLLHPLGVLPANMVRLSVVRIRPLRIRRGTSRTQEPPAPRKKVGYHAPAVAPPANLKDLRGVVDRPADRIVLEMDCAVREI